MSNVSTFVPGVMFIRSPLLSLTYRPNSHFDLSV
ncbi:MAG TPA: hypothetical protein DC054_18585 [Blastocatellia bacterium]|nr:hypothetical protein [Blastocatellia bacterium]